MMAPGATGSDVTTGSSLKQAQQKISATYGACSQNETPTEYVRTTDASLPNPLIVG